MDLSEVEKLLRAYHQGEIDLHGAARQISDLHYEDIGFARVDHGRAARQGFALAKVTVILVSRDRVAAPLLTTKPVTTGVLAVPTSTAPRSIVPWVRVAPR